MRADPASRAEGYATATLEYRPSGREGHRRAAEPERQWCRPAKPRQSSRRDSRTAQIPAKFVELPPDPVYASADALAIFTTRPDLTGDAKHPAAMRLLRLVHRSRQAISRRGR